MRAAFENLDPMTRWLAVGTALALLFQYGHFLEHVIQVAAWIGGHTQSAYMTEIGMQLTHMLGQVFFGQEGPERMHRLGMEALHLFGNAVFFVGVWGLWHFVKSPVMRVALFVQSFHLGEHVLLTFTAYTFDTSIGFSTLFGYPMTDFVSVAFRVWWHFLFNAIPTTLCTIALVRAYQDRPTAGYAVEIPTAEFLRARLPS